MNRHTISKIIFIIVIVLGVVFAGIVIWGNYAAPKAGEIKTPDIKQAPYSLTAKTTSTVWFADKVEVVGDAPGSRTFILNGYWELQGRTFARKNSTLVMSEKIFGEITLKKRATG